MPDTTASSGSLFMVVAPSGAGKSTLVNALLAQEPAHQAVDLVHHARAAPGRAARPRISLHLRRRFHGARATPANSWNGPKCMAITTAPRASDRRAANEDRHRRPAGNRLAGRAAGEEAVSACGRHLHPAAVDRGAGRAPEKARHRTSRTSSRAACWPPAARSRTRPSSSMLLLIKSLQRRLVRTECDRQSDPLPVCATGGAQRIAVRPAGHPCATVLYTLNHCHFQE